MACHLSALVLYVGIPFGNLIGPLVVWLMKRDEFRLVDAHGREALNFNISITIYTFICILLIFVLVGIPLLFLMPLFHIIPIIIAVVRLSSGGFFYYPLTIRFL